MGKYQQIPMFDAGEDLPLFSGTAPRATMKQFNPGDANVQETLSECQVCHDTGQVESTYCTCDAARDLRKHRRIEREAERIAERSALAHELRSVDY